MITNNLSTSYSVEIFVVMRNKEIPIFGYIYYFKPNRDVFIVTVKEGILNCSITLKR